MRPDPRQTQFLTVITRDEATERFQRHLRLAPLGRETLPLGDAVGRVLAEDIRRDPSTCRASTVRTSTASRCRRPAPHGAMEESVRSMELNDEVLPPGTVPRLPVTASRATTIATGGMLPRGADAVVMVEHTEVIADGRRLEVRRAAVAGENVSYAGTDIASGETVLRAGQILTSREIGVLAAIGLAEVPVYRQPKVAIMSTGRRDRRARRTASKRRGLRLERGDHRGRRARSWAACPCISASSPTTTPHSKRHLGKALQFDVVMLSGGTSKGAGDLSYRVVSRLRRSRHRRAWRGAQAGQADLPRGHERQAGGHAAGVSDVGDLHVSRVRRAGDPRVRWTWGPIAGRR